MANSSFAPSSTSNPSSTSSTPSMTSPPPTLTSPLTVVPDIFSAQRPCAQEGRASQDSHEFLSPRSVGVKVEQQPRTHSPLIYPQPANASGFADTSRSPWATQSTSTGGLPSHPYDGFSSLNPLSHSPILHTLQLHEPQFGDGTSVLQPQRTRTVPGSYGAHISTCLSYSPDQTFQKV